MRVIRLVTNGGEGIDSAFQNVIINVNYYHIRKGELIMMEQGLFNKVVTERIMDFMPPIYEDYVPKTEKINKVNEVKTALMLLPDGCENYTATPMVYLEDMYEYFEQEEDLDDTLRFIANIFMNTLRDPYKTPGIDFDFKDYKNKVVMQIISTDRNVQLLENLPHRNVLNMSVIYRVIMRCNEEGIDSVLVNESIMKDMEIDMNQLHSLALKNTKEMFEPEIYELSAKALMVSNKYQMFGSASLLFNDLMDELSRRLHDDHLYVIPCSIHEFIAVPSDGTDLESLIAMLAESNEEFVREQDILSNSIYKYDSKTARMTKAATYA